MEAKIVDHGNIVEVLLSGDFKDGAVWQEHSETISDTLAEKQIMLLAINMCRVRSISSVGLGSLIFVAKKLIGAGGGVALVAVPPRIMAVMRQASLENVFRFWRTMDDLKAEIGGTLSG